MTVRRDIHETFKPILLPKITKKQRKPVKDFKKNFAITMSFRALTLVVEQQEGNWHVTTCSQKGWSNNKKLKAET